jgi:glycosyltransferase involved in cell wall biosynthesis
MKILYVVRGLNQSSGTTHAIIPMAEEMARQGHEVWLYAVHKPADAVEVLPDASLVKTRMFKMSLPMDHPGFSAGFAMAMRRDARTFDVIHIQAVRNFVTWWTMRCACNAGVPYIVAPQGSYDSWVLAQRSWMNRLWDRWLEIPLLNRAARIQCLTAREMEQVRNAGIKAPSVVIPNGVELQKDEGGNLKPERKNARKALGIAENAIVILFLGRIHPKKGLDILVRAFARVCDTISDSRRLALPTSNQQPTTSNCLLLIAGSDGGSGYRDQIEERIRTAGISDKVKWLGEVRGEAKSQTLRAADIFVLPSHSEGLPVAVLEAMADGLPVVLSEACNLPEIAEWNAGRVTREDTSDVFVALRELLSDSALREVCGANARRLVASKFVWSTIAYDTVKYYKEMMS